MTVTNADSQRLRLENWEALATAVYQLPFPNEVRTVHLWPNNWNQDTAAVAFLIHTQIAELAETKAKLEAAENALRGTLEVGGYDYFSARVREAEENAHNACYVAAQTEAKLAKAVAALKSIAQQRNPCELKEDSKEPGYEHGKPDFETGYDMCIEVARTALREIRGGK